MVKWFKLFKGMCKKHRGTAIGGDPYIYIYMWQKFRKIAGSCVLGLGSSRVLGLGSSAPLSGAEAGGGGGGEIPK